MSFQFARVVFAQRRFDLNRRPVPLDTTRFRVPPRSGEQRRLFTEG